MGAQTKKGDKENKGDREPNLIVPNANQEEFILPT